MTEFEVFHTSWGGWKFFEAHTDLEAAKNAVEMIPWGELHRKFREARPTRRLRSMPVYVFCMPVRQLSNRRITYIVVEARIEASKLEFRAWEISPSQPEEPAQSCQKTLKVVYQ